MRIEARTGVGAREKRINGGESNSIRSDGCDWSSLKVIVVGKVMSRVRWTREPDSEPGLIWRYGGVCCLRWVRSLRSSEVVAAVSVNVFGRHQFFVPGRGG